MSSLLRRMLGQSPKAEAPAKSLPYEDARRMIASERPSDRRAVANSRGAHPEMLFFLAGDATPEVRAAVAANEATPRQADRRLVADNDERVRCALAAKIARLAPGITPHETDQLRRLTYECLEALAQDQADRVRAIVAETIKEMPTASPDLVGQLARDTVIEVAGPVLRFSPVLSDDDLMAIIAECGWGPKLRFIAHRAGLSGPVSDAIAGTTDQEAIRTLLSNGSAQIREETLDALIERSREIAAWHPPLARRPKLSAASLCKLAQFVASEVLAVMQARSDLDDASADVLAEAVKERLAREATTAEQGRDGGRPVDDGNLRRAALDEARRLKRSGSLTPERIVEATENDRLLAAACLAVAADVPLDSVERALAGRSAKAVVALAWKAQLTARDAERLQLKLAMIPPQAILRCRGGTDWPLSASSMTWHLEFLGAPAAG
jgi:uncharacterized protein (DUF2336 family)